MKIVKFAHKPLENALYAFKDTIKKMENAYYKTRSQDVYRKKFPKLVETK